MPFFFLRVATSEVTSDRRSAYVVEDNDDVTEKFSEKHEFEDAEKLVLPDISMPKAKVAAWSKHTGPFVDDEDDDLGATGHEAHAEAAVAGASSSTAKIWSKLQRQAKRYNSSIVTLRIVR